MTLPQRRRRWMAIGGAAAIVLVAVLFLMLRQPAAPAATDAGRIVGRGRLEPIGRVHLVSGPSEGGTIAELRVEEGAHVRQGQILAVLDRYASADAAVLSAERDVEVARLQRRQVSAGAKEADVAAQQALVGTRQAELQRAQQQFDRADKLNAQRFISADALEERGLAVQRGHEALDQARASLRAMTQTRPIDQEVAEAQIQQADARLAGARATLERAVIRAPIDGTVLAIYVRSGGALGTQGLMTIGDISQMIAVGEFDEEIAARVRPGQRAMVALRGGGLAFRGRVFRMLSNVSRNDRTTSDVLTGRDARVAEAEIHFDAGQRVPPLVGAEAVVTIAP